MTRYSVGFQRQYYAVTVKSPADRRAIRRLRVLSGQDGGRFLTTWLRVEWVRTTTRASREQWRILCGQTRPVSAAWLGRHIDGILGG